MKWALTLATAWTILALVSAYQRALPASYWFEVDSIQVADSSPEHCPEMLVEREIKHEFYARWVVTIMRQRKDGTYRTYMTFTGANDYRPGNALPQNVDLCWWANVERLHLRPGKYKVNSMWMLSPDSGGEKRLRVTSNEFSIKET